MLLAGPRVLLFYFNATGMYGFVTGGCLVRGLSVLIALVGDRGLAVGCECVWDVCGGAFEADFKELSGFFFLLRAEKTRK